MLVIPTYNERDNIAELMSRIRKAAPREGVLFVDYNSPDGTAQEIGRLQRQDYRIHLLVRKQKLGYGSACRRAMQEIVDENLDDHVIQFDADLSHPPELLPRMIALLRSYPVVIGSRYVAGGGTRNWSWRRRWLSRGANRYARLLTKVPVRDMTAGFVGYRTSVLRELDLSGLHSEGYAFLMEMKYVLHQRAVDFCEFPIVFSERIDGKSKFNHKIMLEGVRFPLRVFWKGLSGEQEQPGLTPVAGCGRPPALLTPQNFESGAKASASVTETSS